MFGARHLSTMGEQAKSDLSNYFPIKSEHFARSVASLSINIHQNDRTRMYEARCGFNGEPLSHSGTDEGFRLRDPGVQRA